MMFVSCKCITCKKEMDYKERSKSKLPFANLYCSDSCAMDCGHVFHNRDYYDRRMKESDFDYIIDEYVVADDLRKDTYVYQQLYNY